MDDELHAFCAGKRRADERVRGLQQVVGLQAASCCSQMVHALTSLRELRCSILSNLGRQALQEICAPRASAASTSSSSTASAGWWLMPPGTAQEEHRRRHARGHHHGVMAGAAGHRASPAFPPASIASARNAVSRSSMGTAGWSIWPVRCRASPRRRGNRICAFGQFLHSGCAHGIVRVAHI